MFALVTDRAARGGPRLGPLAVVVVFFGAGLVDLAAAQEKKPTYEVTVWAIRATKSNNKVSPKLKHVAQELKKRFKYTGFKLEKNKTQRVNEGKALAADLIGGFKVKVTPLERKGNRVKLKVEVPQRETKKSKKDKDNKDRKKKPLVSTTFTITRARFQLLGGWKIDPKGEDVLIIAVSAR